VPAPPPPKTPLVEEVLPLGGLLPVPPLLVPDEVAIPPVPAPPDDALPDELELEALVLVDELLDVAVPGHVAAPPQVQG
jgi:hypothetical protein